MAPEDCRKRTHELYCFSPSLGRIRRGRHLRPPELDGRPRARAAPLGHTCSAARGAARARHRARARARLRRQLCWEEDLCPGPQHRSLSTCEEDLGEGPPRRTFAQVLLGQGGPGRRTFDQVLLAGGGGGAGATAVGGAAAPLPAHRAEPAGHHTHRRAAPRWLHGAAGPAGRNASRRAPSAGRRGRSAPKPQRAAHPRRSRQRRQLWARRSGKARTLLITTVRSSCQVLGQVLVPGPRARSSLQVLAPGPRPAPGPPHRTWHEVRRHLHGGPHRRTSQEDLISRVVCGQQGSCVRFLARRAARAAVVAGSPSCSASCSANRHSCHVSDAHTRGGGGGGGGGVIRAEPAC